MTVNLKKLRTLTLHLSQQDKAAFQRTVFQIVIIIIITIIVALVTVQINSATPDLLLIH